MFKFLGGCNHTQFRLERRPAPKQEFNIGLPGLDTAISVKGKTPDYIYYCPACKTNLPANENAHWEALYNTTRAGTTRSVPVTARPKAATPAGTTKSKYQRKAIGDKLRFDILTRDKYRCVKCGASGKEAQLEVDHKTPVSHGGTNDPSNLQTLCRRCNSGKGARVG